MLVIILRLLLRIGIQLPQFIAHEELGVLIVVLIVVFCGLRLVNYLMTNILLIEDTEFKAFLNQFVQSLLLLRNLLRLLI